MVEELSYELLADAVGGDAVAFRSRTRLEPVGGPTDKIFPATFAEEMTVPEPFDGRPAVPRRRSKYALEWRRVGGETRLCVVIDSVASQANRFEEALLDAWNAGRLRFPIVRVDFRGAAHEDPALDLSVLGGDGFVTALEAPHRLADALLRDSLLDGVPFRASKPGRRFTEATVSHATPIFDVCPTALVFGVWDSTGPRGGLGAKFQRALVSEIYGVGVELGVKSASRIDPTGIEKTEIYETPKGDWTAEESEAKRVEGKPVLYQRKGEKSGTPAVINHGNVTPTLDPVAGGVTVDYAEQVTVLSLPALRRLRFPTRSDGSPFDPQDQHRAEVAARTCLAALALAAVVEQRQRGYDLRSRCALRPLSGMHLELLDSSGGEPAQFTLSATGAAELLRAAAAEAEGMGLEWPTEPIDLTPADRLVALIRRSRELATAEEG